MFNYKFVISSVENNIKIICNTLNKSFKHYEMANNY